MSFACRVTLPALQRQLAASLEQENVLGCSLASNFLQLLRGRARELQDRLPIKPGVWSSEECPPLPWGLERGAGSQPQVLTPPLPPGHLFCEGDLGPDLLMLRKLPGTLSREISFFLRPRALRIPLGTTCRKRFWFASKIRHL